MVQCGRCTAVSSLPPPPVAFVRGLTSLPWGRPGGGGMSGGRGLGVPMRLLHEAEGHVVQCELKTGEVYRGVLLTAEDNWNVQLGASAIGGGPGEGPGLTCTGRDGQVDATQTHVFLRGSNIRMLVVPDLLAQAPVLHRQRPPKAAGAYRPLVKAGAGVAGGGGGGQGRGRGRAGGGRGGGAGRGGRQDGGASAAKRPRS